MTSSHAKKKQKQKNKNNNKTQRGCEMNQLEMTLMNHYKVNTDDHLCFPAIKKSAHGPNTVSYFYFTHTGFTVCNNNSVRNKAEILLT